MLKLSHKVLYMFSTVNPIITSLLLSLTLPLPLSANTESKWDSVGERYSGDNMNVR